LLSFALSFDDFIITRFNNGPVETFPVYVFTAAARGLPAEANVIASAVFIFALVLVIVGQTSSAARRRRLAKLT
ncbi:MAG: ABC transporter permease, partial [Salinibacterium sp.]|nr:ABC transporter permease [Salinibacterium sp.]